eukprot:618725-Pyramimonas_sp.AAC.1
MSSARRWLEMAIPPPMYCRSSMIRGRPSPISNPASAAWRRQMEHSPWCSWYTSAGCTMSSSTRRGASDVKSRASIPAQIFGQPCLSAILRWWAKVARAPAWRMTLASLA